MTLKDELAQPDLQRDQIFSLYARAIKERIAPSRIDFHAPDELHIETADGQTCTVYMQNLWLQCSNSGESKSDVFERYLAALVSVVQAGHQQSGREDIIPTIKDDHYLGLFGADLSIVQEHLAGDLWIIYAVDLPTSIQALSTSKMRELHLSTTELRPLALDNLRRILPPVEQHGSGPWYMLTAGGNYTASILLLDDIWAELQASVEGDIVAAIPSRDVLLFTGSHSREGIEKVRQMSREVYESGDHVISQTLLRRISREWNVFE